MFRILMPAAATLVVSGASAQDFTCAGWQPPRVDEEAFTVSIANEVLTWSNGKNSISADLLTHSFGQAIFASEPPERLFSVHGVVDLGADELAFEDEPITVHMTTLTPVSVNGYTAECEQGPTRPSEDD